MSNINLSDAIALGGAAIALIALSVASIQLVYQKRSFLTSKSTISNSVAEWETATFDDTQEIYEEIITVRTTNESHFATAVESARFEFYKSDDNNRWSLVDLVQTSMETQTKMPLTIESAGSILLRFTFDARRSCLLRDCKVLFVQRFIREKHEIKKEIFVGRGSFMFDGNGACT